MSTRTGRWLSTRPTIRWQACATCSTRRPTRWPWNARVASRMGRRSAREASADGSGFTRFPSGVGAAPGKLRATLADPGKPRLAAQSAGGTTHWHRGQPPFVGEVEPCINGRVAPGAYSVRTGGWLIASRAEEDGTASRRMADRHSPHTIRAGGVAGLSSGGSGPSWAHRLLAGYLCHGGLPFAVDREVIDPTREVRLPDLLPLATLRALDHPQAAEVVTDERMARRSHRGIEGDASGRWPSMVRGRSLNPLERGKPSRWVTLRAMRARRPRSPGRPARGRRPLAVRLPPSAAGAAARLDVSIQLGAAAVNPSPIVGTAFLRLAFMQRSHVERHTLAGASRHAGALLYGTILVS